MTTTISRREVAWASLAGVATSVLMHMPVVLHMTTRVPHETHDTLLQSWEMAWNGHALVHQPTQLFQANAFWPLEDSLAFSDSLVGYLPASLIGHGPTAALVRYNLLYLFAYALAFVGMYLLARQIGVRRLAAGVAGLAFTYSPFRLGQDGHLNILSSGGIPLALFLLMRGYGSGRPRYVVAGWLVAAWQMSLGFALGLQFGYLLAVLAVLVLVRWLLQGRPPVPRGVVVATVVGGFVFVAVSGLMARPYLRAVDTYPEARRTWGDVNVFSPTARSLLVAPEESRLWGGASKEARAKIPNPTEQAVLPGVTLLCLAGYGLVHGSGRGRLRVGLVVGMGVCTVLALGSHGPVGGKLGFRLLFDHAPGWQGVRTPGRIMTLVILGLAMLAALGVEKLAARGQGEWRRAPLVLCSGLAALVLVEGWSRQPYPVVPRAPAGLAAFGGPQLHLPSDQGRDGSYMYWSTDRFPALVNGYSGFQPRLQSEIREAVKYFPDAGSVDYLRRLGVRTVFVHRKLDNDWSIAADRSLIGLGLRRTEVGDVVVFEIER